MVRLTYFDYKYILALYFSESWQILTPRSISGLPKSIKTYDNNMELSKIYSLYENYKFESNNNNFIRAIILRHKYGPKELFLRDLNNI